jgi:uncharacterized protein
MTTMEEIKAFSDKIAEEFHPEQIILFGSYAYGTPGPDSDVDLLVVLPFEGKPWRMASLIRTRVHPSFPTDILARTPSQIHDRIRIRDFFICEITEQGKVLYERGNKRVDS